MLEQELAIEAPAQHVAAEYILLCASLQAEWTPAGVGEVRNVAAQEVDWERFDRLARYHNVAPRVCHSLTEICPEILPEAVRAAYDEVCRAAEVRNRFLVRELHRVIEHLQTCRISALSFKGPLLAKTVYGAYQKRHSLDLDVLIPPAAAKAAEECLSAIGYRRARNASPLRRRLQEVMSGQFELMRGAGVFVLDIHTRLLPPRYTFDLEFDELWDRSHTREVGGRTFQLLPPEDLLLILCHHGVKNRWERLSFLCDVACLLNEHPGLDWNGVLERAQRRGGERALCLGVYVAHKVLESPLPEEIARRLPRLGELKKLARRLTGRLSRQPEVGMLGASERARFHINTQDTGAARLRYAAFSALRRLGSGAGT